MNAKEREKRIKELRTLIYIQTTIMGHISNTRGEYFIELAKLEAQQIEAEAELGCLSE